MIVSTLMSLCYTYDQNLWSSQHSWAFVTRTIRTYDRLNIHEPLLHVRSELIIVSTFMSLCYTYHQNLWSSQPSWAFVTHTIRAYDRLIRLVRSILREPKLHRSDRIIRSSLLNPTQRLMSGLHTCFKLYFANKRELFTVFLLVPK